MEEFAVCVEGIQHIYVMALLCGQNIKMRKENGLGNGRATVVREREKDIKNRKMSLVLDRWIKDLLQNLPTYAQGKDSKTL